MRGDASCANHVLEDKIITIRVRSEELAGVYLINHGILFSQPEGSPRNGDDPGIRFSRVDRPSFFPVSIRNGTRYKSHQKQSSRNGKKMDWKARDGRVLQVGFPGKRVGICLQTMVDDETSAVFVLLDLDGRRISLCYAAAGIDGEQEQEPDQTEWENQTAPAIVWDGNLGR